MENIYRNWMPVPDLFQEAHERMTKTSNFMVFNLPWVADELSDAISGLVDDVFMACQLSVESKYIFARRVGRVGGQPCLIVLSSPTDIRMIPTKSQNKNTLFRTLE